uniref:7TM_GPCR_Srx domain-containing protein n=1 Tax=Haemonchus contortus TaxID=6289 RepID=A0A7I4YXG8_HAECO
MSRALNCCCAVSLNKLNQANFFILATQVLICALGQLLTQLMVAFPLSLYGANIYKGGVTIWIYNFVNVIDTISFNGILWFTLTIAINRFTAFARPLLHDAMFSRSKVWRSSLPTRIMAVVMSSLERSHAFSM